MLREIPESEAGHNDYSQWFFETQRKEWEREQKKEDHIPRCPNDHKAVYAYGLCWTCFQAALKKAGGFDNFIKQEKLTPDVTVRG